MALFGLGQDNSASTGDDRGIRTRQYQPGGPSGDGMGDNPYAGMSADAMQAQILRRDYYRYQNTYQPLEDLLFERLGNWDNETSNAQNTAMQDVSRGFRSAKGSQERELRSYGITMDPQQRAAADRKFDIAAATSAVEAANRTGEQMQDLKYGLVGGFSPYKVGG